MSVDRSGWPLFVRVTLWGITKRSMAWAFVGLCVVLAVVASLQAVTHGLTRLNVFLAVWFAIAAFAYFRSLRWVDQFSSWS